MKYTPNYGLKKPEQDDFYNIEDFNENADIIDEKLKEIEEKAENIEVPVTSVNNKTGDVQLTADDVGAETPAGAQAKADAALNSAKQYTDQEVAEVSQALDAHKSDKANPHNVTKAQIGLNNVDNVKQASKQEFDAHLAETASQAHLAKNIGIEDTGGNFTSNHVEGALNELFTSVSNGKNKLETAITDKGGTVSKQGSIATFDELDTGIRSIPQAKGNALPGDVLSGKTFSSENAGIEVTGTMPNRGAVVITPSTQNQTILAGYHNGQGYVIGDSDLKASNIKKGVTIFGVTGNVEEGSPVTSGTDLSIYESKRTNRVYASSYTLYEESTLKVYGTVNVYVLVFACGYEGDTGNFQVRRNGVTVASGTVTCNSPTQNPVGFYGRASINQNITVSKGDNIQLYFKWNGVNTDNLAPWGQSGMSLDEAGSFRLRVSQSSFTY